jgi:predicted flap endonuclease-1-like 5' DNA nuclease
MKLPIPRLQTVINVAAGLLMILFDEMTGGEDAQEVADDLTEISGIGPTYAQRLNEAGVVNYNQLAGLSPQRIREILHIAEWQGDPEEWIAQARERA